MVGYLQKDLQILLLLLEQAYLHWFIFLHQKRLNVVRCHLHAPGCRNHPIICQTLCNFLDPVVQPRNQSIVKLKRGEQGFLEFEVELDKLEEADLKLFLIIFEEVEDGLDDLLEEGVVIDSQLSIDVGGCPLVHWTVMNVYEYNKIICNLLSIPLTRIHLRDHPNHDFVHLVKSEFIIGVVEPLIQKIGWVAHDLLLPPVFWILFFISDYPLHDLLTFGRRMSLYKKQFGHKLYADF